MRDYNFYNGKIIRIEDTNVSVPSMGRGNGGYETVYMPEVKYLRNERDTIVFLEGRRNIFVIFYDVGDSVTVIEDISNADNIQILTFWYYIKFYEIILLVLISSVLFGMYWAINNFHS